MLKNCLRSSWLSCTALSGEFRQHFEDCDVPTVARIAFETSREAVTGLCVAGQV
jgi:hypothetical protein